jgi:hypothetical protein
MLPARPFAGDTYLYTSALDPNPVQRGHEARLKISVPKAGIATINIMAADGHSVSHKKLHLLAGLNTLAIPTLPLAQGIYIVHIEVMGKPTNLKLLVQ